LEEIGAVEHFVAGIGFLARCPVEKSGFGGEVAALTEEFRAVHEEEAVLFSKIVGEMAADKTGGSGEYDHAVTLNQFRRPRQRLCSSRAFRYDARHARHLA